MRLLSLGLVGLWGCASPRAADLTWDFSARTVIEDVAVMPVIDLSEAASLDARTWVGAGLTPTRKATREARMQSMKRLPEAFRMALPGEIHAELGTRWDGRFVSGRYGAGQRGALEAALRGERDLDEALGKMSRHQEHASLVTWVRQIEGTPLTSLGPPGELVETQVGPVFIDLFDEPYRVEALVGCALVAPGGEVVLRYEQHVQGVLAATRPEERTGRELAAGLAEQLSYIWATDPGMAPQLASR